MVSSSSPSTSRMLSCTSLRNGYRSGCHVPSWTRQCRAFTCSYSSVGSEGRTACAASRAAPTLPRTDGPRVPLITISTAWSRRPVLPPGQPASSMKPIQKSGPGSSVRSSDSDTWTPRMRARWSARSRWRPSKVSDVAARLSTAVYPVFIVGHHPGVAAAPALRAVDDQRARLQSHACEAATGDMNFAAGQDERPQVLVGAAQPAAVEDRLHRERHDGLGDERPWPRFDAPAKTIALFARGSRTDQHPVAARRVDRLHDQVVEMFEDVPPVLVHRAEVCVHVGQDRILAQVVADDRGYEGVNGLVVGDPAAEAVGERAAAGPSRLDEPCHADQRLLPAEDRVQPIVVEAAVDDVDRLEAVRRTHEHGVQIDDQVGAPHQLDPPLLGEVQGLLVSGVFDAPPP